MSILQVDLKMPGGMYVHFPSLVTTTLVGLGEVGEKVSAHFELLCGCWKGSSQLLLSITSYLNLILSKQLGFVQHGQCQRRQLSAPLLMPPHVEGMVPDSSILGTNKCLVQYCWVDLGCDNRMFAA